jgi:SAM-dependent methyltransferase
MQSAGAHYESHLGPIYSWMLGDLDAAFARGAAEVDELKLGVAAGALAVDLGAGLGLHALPLAQRGFKVTAIDSCQVLLDELRLRGAGLPISVHNADILDFRSHIKERAAVILCMGDTLTHLPSMTAVESLFASVADSLASGGVFAATFRDYATKTLEGDARFILVRADEQRILTCFLEYAEQHVTVHDVLNSKEQGRWRQTVSSYPKLRLAPERVAARLGELGLSVRRDSTSNGMARIVAIRNVTGPR